MDPHALKMTRQGTAIKGYTGFNPGDHGIKVIQGSAPAIMGFRLLGIKLHIALLDIQELHFMTPLFPGFKDPLIAVQFYITCQQGNLESAFAGFFFLIEIEDIFRGEASQAEALRGINNEAFCHSFPPQQHSISHRIPVGQGQLDIPLLITQLHSSGDNITGLRKSAGAFDRAAINDWFLAADNNATIALNRMDLKAIVALLSAERNQSLMEEVLAPESMRALMAGSMMSGKEHHSSLPMIVFDWSNDTKMFSFSSLKGGRE